MARLFALRNVRDEWPPSSPGLPSLCREAADDGRMGGEARVFFTHDARLPFMNTGAAEYLGTAFFWPSPFMAELVYKLDLGISENFWLI